MVRGGLEQRHGTRVIMTYGELAEHELVWGRLLKHQKWEETRIPNERYVTEKGN
eukprot:CAMPEP_0185780572 /NCGR_PEP_ID=MMETSP1174-20130828/99545_1 /TAXON_ID=35687 /ORGANISM="Dictyocha speculum, Strain CCMP1381" /LENGTH=53 /DNA_ID=CAMNT_0028470189 /DNA_START=18 /DNA_END=179 /DNA_ORIENTATION=-